MDLTAKTGVVVVHADADEAFVGGQVIDAVWDRFADCIGREVVDVHQVGLALRLPLASAVLEVSCNRGRAAAWPPSCG
jgi:hypothetical protein